MILKPISGTFNKEFHEIIWKAKDYVREHYEDLKKLSVGRYELDKEICEGAFINVSEYESKDDPPWESHLKFVDVQIIFEGAEDFIIANTSTLKPKEYVEETDYQAWEGEGSLRLTLKPGDLLILLPYDAHRVGLAPKTGKTRVKKGIIKVPYSVKSL